MHERNVHGASRSPTQERRNTLSQTALHCVPAPFVSSWSAVLGCVWQLYVCFVCFCVFLVTLAAFDRCRSVARRDAGGASRLRRGLQGRDRGALRSISLKRGGVLWSCSVCGCWTVFAFVADGFAAKLVLALMDHGCHDSSGGRSGFGFRTWRVHTRGRRFAGGSRHDSVAYD